jgi:hypothetical protein
MRVSIDRDGCRLGLPCRFNGVEDGMTSPSRLEEV